jgi:pSer/pThr/pTyr-binding forkhead associated (FHA) protein
MQLSFPNGEHRDVNFEAGEVKIGSRADMMISLPESGLATHHASIYADRRGTWLKVVENQSGVHLNGRPVKQLAYLRAGDLICIEQLRMQLREANANAIVRKIPEGAPINTNEAQRVSAVRLLLRSLNGQHFGRTYGLVTPITIGSGINADISLEDKAIAEKHASVEWHGDRVVLRAANPDTISYVNGIPVTDAVLAPGDQITIEQARFLLEAPGLPSRGRDLDVVQGATASTQTIQKVKASIPQEHTSTKNQNEPETESESDTPSSDSNALWWLIAAAASLAAILTALLVYAPRGGS